MFSIQQIDVPKPSLEIQEFLEAQRKGRDLSDVEYVEDYLASKYNTLVQQAQAYSDYGVLDGKKESRNEKESPTVHTAPNHKLKLMADEPVFKSALLERLRRGNFYAYFCYTAICVIVIVDLGKPSTGHSLVTQVSF